MNYLPFLTSLAPFLAATGVAFVATFVALVVRRRVPAKAPWESASDKEIDAFLEWRAEDEQKKVEASALNVAEEEAERLSCGECKFNYLAKDGHECPSVKISSDNCLPGWKNITVRPVDAIASRDVKEPLHDRVWIPPTTRSGHVEPDYQGSFGPMRIDFFRRLSVGMIDPNFQTGYKSNADTSVRGYSLLPSGYKFHWFKAKVVIDEGSDQQDVNEIKNKGAFVVCFAHSTFRTFLGHEVISEQGADVTIGGRPHEILGLESVAVYIETTGMKLRKGLWVRFMFQGIQERAICG